MTELATLFNELTELESELFFGRAKHWGSWMFDVGGVLIAKGLGSKRDGSIYFDTPLADELRAYANTIQDNPHAQ